MAPATEGLTDFSWASDKAHVCCVGVSQGFCALLSNVAGILVPQVALVELAFADAGIGAFSVYLVFPDSGVPASGGWDRQMTGQAAGCKSEAYQQTLVGFPRSIPQPQKHAFQRVSMPAGPVPIHTQNHMYRSAKEILFL